MADVHPGDQGASDASRPSVVTASSLRWTRQRPGNVGERLASAMSLLSFRSEYDHGSVLCLGMTTRSSASVGLELRTP